MLPGMSSIHRFVHTVADGKVGPAQAFPTADVNSIRIRRRQSQRPNGAGRLAVEDGIPSVAEVRRLPDSTIIWSHVEDVRLARNAGDRHRAAAAKWTDQAPMKFLIHRRIIGLGGKRGKKWRNAKRGE